ncbi:MAG: pyridoxine 5'-phosphate synthase [Phycisphaeraceae bacterium]|nr:pyridoxine 5'-phosphate synthase [Phycisphaeraceae bacterium]
MIRLGVNIDHVATLRRARYPQLGGADEPDPVRAAHEAELGGADGVTVHLREDRRHIQDRDVEMLGRLARSKLNLEMAATDEMVEIACRLRPHTAMLVPEGRMEVTTEGGLDVAGQRAHLRDVVRRLREAGLIVSAFIDADEHQVEASRATGFDVCEVHTGPYAGAFAACGGDFRRAELRRELDRVTRAGEKIRTLDMRFNAGHALNYQNVGPIAALDGVEELHIGHAIVSRAVFVGLRSAVAEMKSIMSRWALESGRPA